MKPVFVSDLDGTLLGPDSRLSPRSRKALMRLISNQIPFTVATARGAASVAELFHGISLPFPIIELNGALITDLGSGRHLDVRGIPGDLAASLCEALIEAGAAPALSVLRGDRDHLFYKPHLDFSKPDYEKELLLVTNESSEAVSDFAEACKSVVLTINCLGLPENLVRFREVAAELAPMSLSTVSYGLPPQGAMAWFSIHHHTVSKAQALCRWQKVTGLTNHTPVVFGDGENDQSLFYQFPHSVAVANAIPALREKAALQVGYHHEDAVARFLEDWLEGRVGFHSFPVPTPAV